MKRALDLRSDDELACHLLATPTIAVNPGRNSTGTNTVTQHYNFTTETVYGSEIS